MTTIESLESRLQAIESRNKLVSLDKKREISVARKVCISILTYIVLGIYMYSLGIQYWYLQALIPTIGFIFSTLSIKWYKKKWVKHHM